MARALVPGLCGFPISVGCGVERCQLVSLIVDAHLAACAQYTGVGGVASTADAVSDPTEVFPRSAAARRKRATTAKVSSAVPGLRVRRRAIHGGVVRTCVLTSMAPTPGSTRAVPSGSSESTPRCTATGMHLFLA